MKKTFFLFFLSFLVIAGFAQDIRYSRVEIYTDSEGLQQIASMGISLDGAQVRMGHSVILELSSREIEAINQAGYKTETLIKDVESFYEERNRPYLDNLEAVKGTRNSLDMVWPVPEGFDLGSVGGFCSIDQMLAHLDTMASRYPDLISPKYTLDSMTYDGQYIYWVRLSDNPTVDEDEPEVLFTGLHHAREAIGMQIQLYLMYYLLENYATDPEVQYLVDNFELYFVPVLNMDGYARNIQTNPDGGGMWRKNRSYNGDGSYGKDLNRNYGYGWGYDDSGSSPYPEDETYRGPYGFSEVETQSMKNFCESHEFRIALNYHSYSDLLLYPWGYIPDLCEDDMIFNRFGSIMTQENGYTYGPGYTTIYVTNGSSDDWMYGEQDTKGPIFSYTPEVGGGSDGFWPSVSRIIPLCQENMWQNFMAIKLSGAYAVVSDNSPTIIQETSGMFDFEIERLGLEDGATFSVSITPLNDAIETVGDPVEFSGMEILETQPGSIEYTLSQEIQGGDQIMYLLSVDNGMITTSDTIIKVFGTPVIVFEDNASSMANWNSGKWNTTTYKYYSPETSITDSPFGAYNNNETNYITLSEPIDLTGAAYAQLNFQAQWEIEAGYDYVQVLASLDEGNTWVPLEGKYTKTGTSYQAYMEPVYDGYQYEWVYEEMNLEEFLGHEILIRFLLKSDSYVYEDGFYWDDLSLTIVDMATGTSEHDLSADISVIGPIPNPASDWVGFEVRSAGKTSLLQVEIVNNSGQVVTRREFPAGQTTLTVPVSALAEGVYFYRITRQGQPVGTGKLLISH